MENVVKFEALLGFEVNGVVHCGFRVCALLLV